MDISIEAIRAIEPWQQMVARLEREEHQAAGLCMVYTKDTDLCENLATAGQWCAWHNKPRCRSYTAKGRRCLNRTSEGSKFCTRHDYKGTA